MNPIEIIFRGKDLTGPATASVKKNLDGVTGAVKQTSSAFDTAMGVLASQQVQRFADAIGGFMKSVIAEASEAGDTMAQLEEVIKSTGGAAGLSADEISDMAQGFSRLTRYEDDAIAAGQTVLLQFTRIGKDVFPQATEAMLNLATRMKIDLPSAAKIVGKALEGEFSGLARFGVVLDNQTKKQIDNLIKMGDTAGAQAMILEELEKRFGGAAEAAGQTFGGSVERLNNAWADLKETIGTALTENEGFQDAIDSLVDIINGLGDAFAKLPEPVQTGMVAVFGLFAALAQLAPVLISLKVLLGAGGLAGAVTAVKGALAGVGGLLAGITAPVWLLIAAIAALIATIVIFGRDALNTLTMLSQIWTAILDRMRTSVLSFITGLLTAFRNGFTQARAAGRNLVQGIWAGIQSGWSWLLNMIGANIDNLLQWVKDKLGIASPSKLFAVEVGEPIALGIAQGFKTGMKAVGDVMVPALQPAPAVAGGISGGMGGATTINVTGGFYSPVTHAERRRIRKDQEEAVYKELRRVLKG